MFQISLLPTIDDKQLYLHDCINRCIASCLPVCLIHPFQYYRQDSDGCTVGIVLATGSTGQRQTSLLTLKHLWRAEWLDSMQIKVKRKSDGREKYEENNVHVYVAKSYCQ